jgi:hypothetical protein
MDNFCTKAAMAQSDFCTKPGQDVPKISPEDPEKTVPNAFLQFALAVENPTCQK